MNKPRFVGIVVIGMLTAVGAGAQPDPWASLRFLEGKWEGPASGEPGKGVSSREFRFDLKGRFLSARNKSVWEPKLPAAKPEIHEDFGMYSYDKALKKVVLRQFHVEGFVNEYTLDSVSGDGKSVEFATVRIENIAAGWRAKESYRILSPDEFVETFLLQLLGKTSRYTPRPT